MWAVTASKLCFSSILVMHWGSNEWRTNLKIQVYLDVVTCWQRVTDVSIDNGAFVFWVKRSNPVYFALLSFETSVIICHMTQRNIPNDFNLQQTIKRHSCGCTGSARVRLVPSTVPRSWRWLSPEQCFWWHRCTVSAALVLFFSSVNVLLCLLSHMFFV